MLLMLETYVEVLEDQEVEILKVTTLLNVCDGD